jgi:hypothetical protein
MSLLAKATAKASLAQAGAYKLAAVITLAETWQSGNVSGRNKKYPLLSLSW